MDKRIRNFIRKKKIMTLSSSNVDVPYCCIVFFSFDEEKNCFYFISNPESRHSEEIFVNQNVAGTIIKSEFNILKLQGIQFTGTCRMLEGTDAEMAGRHYQNTHPVSYWSTEKIWKVEVDWLKMTDNTLGFGNKIIWERVAMLTSKTV